MRTIRRNRRLRVACQKGTKEHVPDAETRGLLRFAVPLSRHHDEPGTDGRLASDARGSRRQQFVVDHKQVIATHFEDTEKDPLHDEAFIRFDDDRQDDGDTPEETGKSTGKDQRGRDLATQKKQDPSIVSSHAGREGLGEWQPLQEERKRQHGDDVAPVERRVRRRVAQRRNDRLARLGVDGRRRQPEVFDDPKDRS